MALIDIKEAHNKAQREAALRYGDYPLKEKYDLGSEWAFYFGTDDDAGAPYITVNKKTGDLGFLIIPPFENLDRLKAGKKLPL